ncbi:Glucoamylase [Pseudocercospora fuligena]|uniref:Glucoamylase n=1 Tax=Pseudocercospora fuligena TaxID=685502 RepID=A0A8H6VE00_9PEZI|nr:Glucoamylase [Pseudocercospora fuligena]
MAVDTNGRGMSACFRGCDKVPGCVGFYYLGTEIGDYRIYAGAHMLLASPQLPCPYYNNSQQVDSQGNTWNVLCGYNGPGTDLATIKVDNMNDCYTACNSNIQCNQFVFTYVGSEPASITGSTVGSCALKSGPYTGTGLTYTDTQNFACRVNNVTSVTFNVLTYTSYDQLIYLAGSIAQLGSWQTNNAIQLNASNYTDISPQWIATVQIPAGTSLEYKYLRREVDGSFTWDNGSNRIRGQQHSNS